MINSTRSTAPDDFSNGYEAVAVEFMGRRERLGIGVATVRRWARSLPPGATVLDLGCGHGVPLSMALIDDGFIIYGIDASPTLAAAFRGRFPHAHVACEAVEDSSFFGRAFEGVLAIGLIFLMSADAQRDLIRKVAQALTPGGRFLFTSPADACAWSDTLTGRQSLSLGTAVYRTALEDAGFGSLDEYLDEGDNHYFDARKRDHSIVMQKSAPAASPDAYVASLDGWQRDCVENLRLAVRAASRLEEVVKWRHLVYLSNGPVLLIRAEEQRVLLGFWRGQRLLAIEQGLKPGGKYEMATLELRKGMSISSTTVRRLTREAVALNKALGDPTRGVQPNKSSRPKPPRGSGTTRRSS